MTKNLVWALSNLCRGKNPPPDFSKVRDMKIWLVMLLSAAFTKLVRFSVMMMMMMMVKITNYNGNDDRVGNNSDYDIKKMMVALIVAIRIMRKTTIYPI